MTTIVPLMMLPSSYGEDDAGDDDLCTSTVGDNDDDERLTTISIQSILLPAATSVAELLDRCENPRKRLKSQMAVKVSCVLYARCLQLPARAVNRLSIHRYYLVCQDA